MGDGEAQGGKTDADANTNTAGAGADADTEPYRLWHCCVWE
jgi:hypothetical protein